MREHDWSSSGLGTPDQWPQALRWALGICLQSSFPTAIYWGPELRLLYNDAWAPIAGDRHPWALGRPAREVWSDIWHVIEPQLNDVLRNAKGVSVFDQMLPMRRGGRIEETYWNYSMTPIVDERGRVAGAFNQGNETTEIVSAARRREAEIDRLRDLFQRTPAAISVLAGPQHVFEIANPAFLQLIGNRPVLGKPVAEALPEVVEQGFVEILDNVFRSGEAYIGRSISIWLQRTPEGELEERLVDFVYQPIKSPAGKVTGIFAQATDVTERAHAEEALRRSEAALRDADRRKDEFLATLAHELRNPLAPITSAAHVIELTSGADPTLRAAAQILARQAHVMVRLVDDLLDVARITHGRIELRMQPVELASIVTSVVEAARPSIDEKHHELLVELPDTPVPLTGDAMRLSQALLNVVNNAVRYTPPGGSIAIRAALDQDQVRIKVTDTGIGIPHESRDKIFDLFARVDDSGKREMGGLGIGLHLARELAVLHGGELTAHSEGPGLGSEFVLTLPVQAPRASAPTAEDAGAEADLTGRRVLVVDDNADAADTLAMNLEVAGHTVRTVYDGAAVLDALRDFTPHAVLLDIGMPGLSGYDVARAIRRLDHGQSIVLIAVSGWGQSEDKRRAAQAGFDEYLTKPADPTEVDRLVRRAGARVER